MSYSKLHFDAIRDDLFHWVFYTHARGKPKSGFPCLNAQAQPAPAASNGTCAVGPNPDFHVPSGASGVAQLPGNKAMIPVGLWDRTNHVGSPELVGSTTLHELGHNGELWHGGQGPVWNPATRLREFAPNCKPGYLSVMSYLFQFPGLLDDNGVAHYDYSRNLYNDIDETNLDDGFLPPAFVALPDRLVCLSYPGRWRTR